MNTSTIIIKKVSRGVYTAEVFNLPPNLTWVKAEWTTAEPLSTDNLIRELVAKGFHQIDIGDAFYAADPDWLAKAPDE
jgi:hypothetical protein